jgi:hypothetical protein
MFRMIPDNQNAVLIVGHPGHELRVHGWMEIVRPLVLVVTDGSGRLGTPRLRSTDALVRSIGATPATLFGRYTDLDIYDRLLRKDHDAFLALADEMCDILLAADADFVAGDAAEGLESTHDVCRMLIDAAVAMASTRGNRRIANHDFLLMGRPDECPADREGAAVRLRLDDAAFARKLKAADDYRELAEEVGAAAAQIGLEPFRHEILRPVSAAAQRASEVRYAAGGDERAPYEVVGEQQVAAGHFQSVIRYAEHIAPLGEALRRHAVT